MHKRSFEQIQKDIADPVLKHMGSDVTSNKPQQKVNVEFKKDYKFPCELKLQDENNKQHRNAHLFLNTIDNHKLGAHGSST